jgi:hypothetical protein
MAVDMPFWDGMARSDGRQWQEAVASVLDVGKDLPLSFNTLSASHSTHVGKQNMSAYW